MSKILVDCGNCGPDFSSIRQMATNQFNATTLQTHGVQDTLQMLLTRKVDLVTVNRKLDRDYSDGLAVISAIKADPRCASVPVMLVTNYQEHQDAAMAIGAVQGFGKLEIGSPATVALLKPYLG